MERILSLDISSKTGYAALTSNDDGTYTLDAYGTIPKVNCPAEEEYPGSYVTWAYTIFGKIEELIEEYQPSVLVIEETCSNSKSAYSQKILEFTHFLVGKYIQETGIKSKYMLTGVWRKLVESKMTKEEKDHNKNVKKYKLQNDTKVAYNSNTGKRIGMKTKKHVSIRRVKELFNLDFKVGENDTSDAILLAFSYHVSKKGSL